MAAGDQECIVKGSYMYIVRGIFLRLANLGGGPQARAVTLQREAMLVME